MSSPHKFLASLKKTFPSFISIYTGVSDLPFIIIPSKPALLNLTPKLPPQFEEAIPPVNTFFVVTLNLADEGVEVPVRGPVLIIKILFSSKGDTPAGKSS